MCLAMSDADSSEEIKGSGNIMLVITASGCGVTPKSSSSIG